MSRADHISPPDMAERERIDTALDTCMLIEAAAGTGKTTKMVDRLVALLAAGKCNAENLAAVTFTRKAASELRSRFVTVLERSASSHADSRVRERLAGALDSIDRAFIGTIHSFCARLLRERPVEAGVAVGFEEADEEAEARVREDAWRLHLDELYAVADPSLDRLEELGLDPSQLRKAFDTVCRYSDLEDRDWPAPETALPDSGPVIAALRWYASHMAAQGVDPPLDPGNDKLIPRYQLIPRLLRSLDLNRPAELAEALEYFGSVTIVQKMWPGGKEQARAEQERWDNFCNEVAAPWQRAWLAHRYRAALEFILAARGRFRGLMAGRGLLSYQDLLVGAAGLLRSHSGVRKYFRARYTHVLVDEFQDTDPVQAEVLLLLTSSDPERDDWRRCKPAPGSLFVVGDPKQSIYRFRRADIVTYNQVRALIEAGGGEVVTLSANFRTEPELIGWINGAFEGRFPADGDLYSPAWVALEPGRPPGERAELSGVGLIHIPKDEKQVTRVEALTVARLIRDALDRGLVLPRTERQLAAGVSPAARPGDFLVITKRKKNLRHFAAALEALGVPCELTGGGALDQVPELKLLALVLECVHRPDNPVLLTAVLRGALCGFSDRELYAFRQAGGRFDYRQRPPEALQSGLRERLTDTFTRLGDFAAHLRRLPAASAFYRIAAELGLFASAAASDGGNLRAGSLAKAIELVRARAARTRSLEELIAFLGELAEGMHEQDSLGALGEGGPAVRLMNLHQAKGLEAPVVFLADPFGEGGRRTPDEHVDREGERPRGYLAIRESVGPYHGKLLACPPDWEEFEERENRFLEAENLRLLYVAATRAGSRLVVTRKEARVNSNPWEFFAEALEGIDPLTVPGAPEPQTATDGDIATPDPRRAALEIERRRQRAGSAGYEVLTAREKAGVGGRDNTLAGAGEFGTERGNLLHSLLQAALKNPERDLRRLAATALREHELPSEFQDEALATVESVRRSDIFRRATAARRSLAEAPFEALDPESPEGVPRIIRGQIDLVFEENGNWVVVDYKTDRAAAEPGGIDRLVEKYAPQVSLYAGLWERLTGMKVSERGLYFTSAGEYVRI